MRVYTSRTRSLDERARTSAGAERRTEAFLSEFMRGDIGKGSFEHPSCLYLVQIFLSRFTIGQLKSKPNEKNEVELFLKSRDSRSANEITD
jgi:hypothetical protein